MSSLFDVFPVFQCMLWSDSANTTRNLFDELAQ